MKYIIFICVFVAFISGCKGYNKWTFQVDDHLTVAYIANHNYFGYYNSNLTLSYMYLHDCQTGIYYNASTGNVLLARADFAYFLRSNTSLSFDSNRSLYNSFDKLHNMSIHFLNLVHGGSALTDNGFNIKQFKTELQKEELQLTTFDAFIEDPELALLLNENFGCLITELRSTLLSENALALNGFEILSSGMQIYNNNNTFAVALFFGAQVLRNINPSDQIISKFHDYLYEGNSRLILKLSSVLFSSKLMYYNEEQALAAKNHYRKQIFKEINSMKELYDFWNDTDSHDWHTLFIGGFNPIAIYYSSINVFIIWKYMNDCFMLFDGNSNNYAVYDQWRGTAIVVDKSKSNALITVKNADKIAHHFQRRNYRESFEEAAKVVNQIIVPSDGKDTFVFNDFVQSAYEFGTNYTYPSKKSIRQQIGKYFYGFAKNLHRIKGYNAKYKAANGILPEFVSIELNNLPCEFVKLINEIGTKPSPGFNKHTMQKVYNDIIDSEKNSFEGVVIFKNVA